MEELGPKWFPGRLEGWLVGAGVALVIAVVFGLLFAVDRDASLREDVLLGAVVGFGLGVVAGFVELRPVEIVRLRWLGVRSRVGPAVRRGLLIGPISALACGVIAGAYSWMTGDSEWLGIGLAAGVYGLTFGLAAALFALAASEAIEARSAPGDGVTRSARTAILGAASVALLVAVPLALMSDTDARVLAQLSIFFGVPAGLLGGGLFAIRYGVSRVIVWARGLGPARYLTFLDYAVDRLFLRRVGGGYIFVHRTLQEYFASLGRTPRDREDEG